MMRVTLGKCPYCYNELPNIEWYDNIKDRKWFCPICRQEVKHEHIKISYIYIGSEDA